MRKNINKLVAFAIGVSIMSGSSMQVFATDTNTQNTSAITSAQANVKSVFTLDQAIKAAISNSEPLKLYEQKISYQEKIDDVNEKINDVNQKDNDDEKDFIEDSKDLNLKKLKQQRDFDEDILIQKTTKEYNNIVTSKKEIDKAERELEINTKELNDIKLKKSLGVETSIGLKDKELSIEKLKNEQKSSENKLKDAQYSFKVLIGKDVTQYSLEQDIKFDAFKIDGSVDEYLDNIIENYLKYSEQLLKLNKDHLDDNKVSDPTKPSDEKPVQESGESAEDYDKRVTKYNTKIYDYRNDLLSRLTYLQSKRDSYEAETNLNENKKNVKELLRSNYTELLTKEDKINSLKKDIELKNKQLSILKLRYDLGLITKTEYSKQAVVTEKSDLELRSSIDDYNNLKEQIQKPWIPMP